jgi:hypothetical protein
MRGEKTISETRRRYEVNLTVDPKKSTFGGYEIDSSHSGHGPVAGFCKHSNKLSATVKGVKRFVQLRNCARWSKLQPRFCF